MYADASTVDSLRRALEGRTVPALHAHSAVTDQRSNIDMAAVGLIIPLAVNTCAQKQIEALKRLQALQDAISEEVPVHVVLVTDIDAETTRMRTLLLRKAIRPTFELWHTNESHPLYRAVLSEQLAPVLVVSDNMVSSVFHTVEHKRIVSTVSSLLATSP